MTDNLKERIRAWQRWFEKEAYYGEEYVRPIVGAEGLEIAREVKAQLPDWTVMYFDTDARDHENPDQPREDYFYGIKGYRVWRAV